MWTVDEAANAWGYKDGSYVKRLCKQGRVPGARLVVKDSRAQYEIPEQDKPGMMKPGRKERK